MNTNIFVCLHDFECFNASQTIFLFLFNFCDLLLSFMLGKQVCNTCTRQLVIKAQMKHLQANQQHYPVVGAGETQPSPQCCIRNDQLARQWWRNTFNPSTLGGRGRPISEFEASLVYRASSRTARATQLKKEKRNDQLAYLFFTFK